jgi:hypothetical protein
MPIRNHPFTLTSGMSRPMLWIKIANPRTKDAIIARAIMDTGADDCVFPAKVAAKLGHNLKAVPPKPIETAGGTTYAYSHTCRVDILGTQPNGMFGSNVLYTIPKMPIDFVMGCDAFLLGVENFLIKFIVTIDYPRQVFSIRKPRKKK